MNPASWKRNIVLAFIALLLDMPLSHAAEVEGLYEIELVANSPSPADRELAIKQALYAVLNRVLVAEDISKIKAVQDVLNNAPYYVKQFQYSLISPDQYTESDVRLLRVEFDEQKLMDVMRNAQVGIWGDIRPKTLLWLVVDQDTGERQFYDPDSMPDVESALTLASKIKGVPLIFPMLDLEERQRISVNDVLGADARQLLSVSARYEVPSVMAGHLARKDQCWQGEWAFYFDGKIKQWNSACQSMTATIKAGVQGAYDVLSAYYGVKPQAASD
ncbi:MAG: DUF2066 domain-containing protein [Methylomonas sp.]|nr:DUF2066 domain-containing protein [Methylomonas sp.]PPD21834.1 MAG: hypothetical protein CTY23_04445 [Methylomonas sp.]PPD27117.1 MAG: hypothetical protein CTY22_02830 [Methylomonas sp.]PPD39071.1 MAG: hypothetical protein CTY21_02825 [Methylomonas sp.]PPD42299.1 MAG: hypothetical protein CTY17_01905 [Methylomonas sp.]